MPVLFVTSSVRTDRPPDLDRDGLTEAGLQDNHILFVFKSEWFSIFERTYRMMFALILDNRSKSRYESQCRAVPGHHAATRIRSLLKGTNNGPISNA